MTDGADYVAWHDQALAAAAELLKKRPSAFAFCAFTGTATELQEAMSGEAPSAELEMAFVAMGPQEIVAMFGRYTIVRAMSGADDEDAVILGDPPPGA